MADLRIPAAHANRVGVTLGVVDIGTAWNVQGARAADIAEGQFGVALPTVPNTMTMAGDVAALWLGPVSWLVVSPARRSDCHAEREAHHAVDAALFDLSASRVAFVVRGARAVDVLASGCPLDLDPAAFGPGRCAQSVFGRVNALYCRPDHGDGFIVMVARSFGRDVWHGVRTAAAEYGYEEVAPVPWPARESR